MFEYRAVMQDGEVAIYEVFLNAEGEPDSLTEQPLSPATQSIEDLRLELRKMLDALDRPVLYFDRGRLTKRPAEKPKIAVVKPSGGE
jgi:hypothetical protein